jgi:hypothetical protein
VQPNSPASGLGIVNWFDFIVRVEIYDGKEEEGEEGGGEDGGKEGEEEGEKGKGEKGRGEKDEKTPPPPVNCTSTSGPPLMSLINYCLSTSTPLLLYIHNTKSLSLRRIPLQPRKFDGVGVLGLTIKADTYYRSFECAVKVMQVEEDGPAR